MSPQCSCRRRWLYQSTHSSTAISTCSAVRHGPRGLNSSVLTGYVGNATVRTDSGGRRVYKQHKHSTRQIDLADCAVMAHSVAATLDPGLQLYWYDQERLSVLVQPRVANQLTKERGARIVTAYDGT
jgi:hypothetical protein